VDGLRELAGAAVAGAGLVLEDVTITSAGRRRVVRIVVDLPADRLGGVPLEAVAQASQAVSAALDTSPVLGQAPYTLEVTSPGVSRPLTQRRHWSRARRRLVEVRLRDGGTVTGRVRAVDDDGIELDGTPAVRLPWDRVERGAVQIEFGSSEEESD